MHFRRIVGTQLGTKMVHISTRKDGVLLRDVTYDIRALSGQLLVRFLLGRLPSIFRYLEAVSVV
jgi:hypothetical protein